jgi:hypothetical protein
MSSVQLVRSNPPPWPKSSLFVRKLLNEAVLDANCLPTLRQLGTLPGVFFSSFLCFFGHYKNRIFQANFLENIHQDVKICPQNAASPPPPFFCQSEAIGAPSIWSLLWPTRLLGFFQWQTFAKFRPEKYDFELYQGFFMENMPQIRQSLKIFFLKSPDFYDKCW